MTYSAPYIHPYSTKAPDVCGYADNYEETRTFGVEFEFDTPSQEDRDHTLVEAHKYFFVEEEGDGFIAKHDSSINMVSGAEFVTTCLSLENQYNLWEKTFDAGAFDKVLPKKDMSKCGIHIHVGNNLENEQTKALFVLFFNHPAFRKFVVNMMDRTSSYASFTDATNVKKILAVSGCNRHVMVNTRNRDRFEVRGFASTNNKIAMLSKIAFVDSVMSYCASVEDIKVFGIGKYIKHLYNTKDTDKSSRLVLNRLKWHAGIDNSGNPETDPSENDMLSHISIGLEITEFDKDVSYRIKRAVKKVKKLGTLKKNFLQDVYRNGFLNALGNRAYSTYTFEDTLTYNKECYSFYIKQYSKILCDILPNIIPYLAKDHSGCVSYYMVPLEDRALVSYLDHVMFLKKNPKYTLWVRSDKDVYFVIPSSETALIEMLRTSWRFTCLSDNCHTSCPVNKVLDAVTSGDMTKVSERYRPFIETYLDSMKEGE